MTAQDIPEDVHSAAFAVLRAALLDDRCGISIRMTMGGGSLRAFLEAIGKGIMADRESRAPTPSPDGWQPIETAPRDGTEVLILRDGRLALGWWSDDPYRPEPVPFWHGTDVHDYGKKWAQKTQPTHWMPLPAAPSPAEPEAGQ